MGNLQNQSEPEQNPVDQLAAEFTSRLRDGQSPTVAEYVARFPDLAAEIEAVFPAILLMEKLGAHEQNQRIDEISRARFQYLREAIEKIGDYRVVREIGRGGMGVVFEAIHEPLNRRVAIKVLPSVSMGPVQARGLQRFQREARTAAKLHHNNIIPIFDVGVENGLCYFVMQFIDGVGLDRLLEQLRGVAHLDTVDLSGQVTQVLEKSRVESSRRNPIAADIAAPVSSDRGQQTAESRGPFHNDQPGLRIADRLYWQRIARLGIDVARALEHAHACGVLHRDIKPSNLILDEEDVIWVADFGLAKEENGMQVTRTGDVLGTLQYMAPEQLAGQADERSDIYGLGATLFELLVLRPIVTGDNMRELIAQVSNRVSGPSLRKINPMIPRDLETIVSKAVSPQPLARYQSAGELAADLERFVAGQPIRARRTSSWELGWRWCKRNPMVASLWLAVATLLATIATISTANYMTESRERQRAESTLEISIDALDKIYRRFVPVRSVSPSEVAIDSEAGGVLLTPAEPSISRETADMLLELLPAYDRLARQNSSNLNLRKATAQATARVGDIQFRLGQYEKAIGALSSAIRKYQEMERKDSLDAHFEIAACLNQLGNAYSAIQRQPRGHQSHQKALEYLDQIDRPTLKDEFERARTLYCLGRPRGSRLDFPPPKPNQPRGTDDDHQLRIDYLDAAASVLEKLIGQAPDVSEYRFLQALVIREKSHLLNEARLESESLEILREVVRQYPTVADYQYELCKSLGYVDIRNYSGMESDDVVVRLESAVQLAESLINRFPHIPRNLQIASSMNHRLSEVLFRNHRFRKNRGHPADILVAEMYARRAVNIQFQLVERHAEVHRIGLARMYQALAMILEYDGRYANAFDCMDRAIVQILTFVHNQPASGPTTGLVESARQALSRYYGLAAHMAGAAGDADEAAILRYLATKTAGTEPNQE